MKETRFIELLNLYVDHQLSATEAAQLEAEITRDPVRLKTYQQYCRMQKACTMLFEQERTSAPASGTLIASLEEADRKVVEFPRRRASSLRPIYTFGGALAAAACVAFVLVSNNSGTTKNSVEMTAQTEATQKPAMVVATTVAPTPEAIQSVAIPAPAMVPAVAKEPRPEFYSVFAAQQSVAYRSNKASDQNEARGDVVVSDDWMQNVKFAPLPSLSDERLAIQPAMSVSNERVLQSRKPFQATTENAAFQFQR